MSQSFRNKMIYPPLERLANVATEAGFRQRDPLARDELAVEPGRTNRRGLSFDRKIRPGCEGEPPLSTAVDSPDLDDSADGRRELQGLSVAKTNMVSAPINCVDDRIGFAGEFIVQTFCDETAYDGGRVAGVNGVVGAWTIDTFCSQGLVHGLNDVAAHSEIAKRCFSINADDPLGWSRICGKTHAFEALQPSYHKAADLRVAGAWLSLDWFDGSQIDETRFVRLASEDRIELRPAIGLHLTFEG